MAFRDPKQLAKQTEYNHDLDIIFATKHANKIYQDARRAVSQPKRSHSSARANLNSYNKWFINPEYQFKQKSNNPKNNKRVVNDELYIYKNLRNEEFWNWVHPFQKSKLPSIKNSGTVQKIDPKIMENFKKYIEDSNNKKRLPSIVDYIIAHNAKPTSIAKPS